MIKSIKHFLPNKKLAVLLGIISMGIAGLSIKQELAKAQESNPMVVATGLNWQSASFPVENFQEYTSAFGPRGGGFHYGLDLAAPMGSYIRSWWNGRIVDIIDDSRCGVGLVIESGYWDHVYCHIQGEVQIYNGTTYFVDRAGGLMLSKGQGINAGTRIARVGMSGRTSGPHLHWGLKYSGRWVDPAIILKQMYAQQIQNGRALRR